MVHEEIHSSFMNREKGMIITIYMENDFDRVKHSFLHSVLRKFGFNRVIYILDWLMYKQSLDSSID
jgi:hypothetical protein